MKTYCHVLACLFTLTALAGAQTPAPPPPLAPPPEGQTQTPPLVTPPDQKAQAAPHTGANTPTGALAAPTVSPPKAQANGAVDIANEPTVKVVANVLPAVVNINAQKTVPQYVTKYDRYFRLYRGVINRTAQSIGSGLIVSADGFIITNAHVVALADPGATVNITLSTGSKYQAKIITADEDADLALLKIDDKTAQFPYFDLTYTSPNLLGETVIALGSPEGYQNSISQGILSAKGRTFTVEDHNYSNLIQTDAAINPGNSGGPLVDLNGGLVGINSAKLSGEAIESIGFAIPHDVVVAWANDAIAVAKGLKPAAASAATTGLQVMKQRLGLSLKTLTESKAADMNLEISGGLQITHVAEDSPAADAGLKEGMIVVAVGSKQVVEEKDLPRELLRLQAGGKVRLQIIFVQSMGLINIQRGQAVVLTAK